MRTEHGRTHQHRLAEHTSADLLMYSFGMKMRHAASFEKTLHMHEQYTICTFDPFLSAIPVASHCICNADCNNVLQKVSRGHQA